MRPEAAVSKRQLVLSRARWQSRERERGSVARAPIGGTRFGSRFSRLLSRKLGKDDLGRSPHNPTAARKRGAGSRREATKRETRRGTRPWERTILTAKTGPPAEAIEGVVKTHRSFRLRTASQGEVRGNRENEEHGCSWSGSGWQLSAARIAAFPEKATERLRILRERLSRSEARIPR
jgi:hypothetical protein